MFSRAIRSSKLSSSSLISHSLVNSLVSSIPHKSLVSPLAIRSFHNHMSQEFVRQLFRSLGLSKAFGIPEPEPAEEQKPQESHFYEPQWDSTPVPMTFVHWDGRRFNVEASVGTTLLDVARKFEIPILGQCEGGDGSENDYGEGPLCRTCHVYVDTKHLKHLPEKGYGEIKQTYWMDDVTGNSRFACEIVVKPELAGMIVLIPYLRDIYREGRDPGAQVLN